MKKNSLMIIVVILITIFISGCTQLKVKTKYLYDDTEYSFGNMAFKEQIDTIDVSWLVGDIIIQKSETEEIIIREDTDANIKDEYKMHYSLKDTKLDIKFSSSFGELEYTYKIKTLYIFLPSQLNNIRITSEKVDIKVNEVEIHNFIVSTTTGDIDIQKSKINSLSLTTILGEIMLFDVNIKKTEIISISGNIGINYNTQPEVLNIGTVSGNILIYIDETSSLGVEFKTTTGKVISKIDYIQEGTIFKFNSPEIIYSVITTSGNLKILKK